MLNLAIDNSGIDGSFSRPELNSVEERKKYKRQFKEIIGQSPEMYEVFRLIEKIAETDSTVIINGETGTGKGLIARAIHKNSNRSKKPFVAINCGAIPRNLLESELFGHVKGAFTGATSSKIGKFEHANGGTVFLDEIGDMSPDLQVKVLKVLEEREFEQVGGAKTIKVDVRIIAATHRNLEEEVRNGNFREDLYYRLFVIPVILPVLKSRSDDIPLLAMHFLAHFNKKNNKKVLGISDDAVENLRKYSWPGNVRELKNIMERLVVLKENEEISIEDLPKKIIKNCDCFTSPQIKLEDDGICLSTAITDFEKALILQSLEKSKWVKNKAAKLLKVNRTTLVEKIKRHHLELNAV